MRWNALLITFLGVFALSVLVRSVLRWLNIRHLRCFGAEVPEVFRDEIDKKTLTSMRDYTISLTRLGSIELIIEDIVTLILVLSGILPFITETGPLKGMHPILSGILFFFIFSIGFEIIETPFTLYRTFVIERRFGFSTITLLLWLEDLVKSLMLSGILMGILLAVILALIYSIPGLWWLLAWGAFVAFQLILTWIYPVVIAPMFNKFDPIEDEGLKNRIHSLMDRAGFRFGGLYKMDASARSRHTNAYFTGIGKTKRIVLFDTLINTHTAEEIIAVLAHELGHLKRGHVKKQLLGSIILSFIGFYLTSVFLVWPLLYKTFGFIEILPYAGLFLLAIIAKPFGFFLMPIGAMISRRFERQADAYAYNLTGTIKPLIHALKRLARDNLANLHPHPIYAWFYYSHPPLVQRVETLEKASKDPSQQLVS